MLEQEAQELNEIFIKNMQKKAVFVALKTATTLDGKIATKTAQSKWITSQTSRNKGKELRTFYDAVLTTSSTVLADNPKFECKTKILLDRQLKCNFDMRYFKTGKIYVATCISNLPNTTENIEFIQCPEKDGQIDLKYLFEKLFEQKIMSIFVEAGGILNGELIEQNLADKIYQFIAPKIIGDNEAKSAYSGRNVEKLDLARDFEIKSIEKLDTDILLTMKKAT